MPLLPSPVVIINLETGRVLVHLPNLIAKLYGASEGEALVVGSPPFTPPAPTGGTL